MLMSALNNWKVSLLIYKDIRVVRLLFLSTVSILYFYENEAGVLPATTIPDRLTRPQHARIDYAECTVRTEYRVHEIHDITRQLLV